jgi:hypothetical protein
VSGGGPWLSASAVFAVVVEEEEEEEEEEEVALALRPRAHRSGAGQAVA